MCVDDGRRLAAAHGPGRLPCGLQSPSKDFSVSFISADPVVDFGGEKQSMDGVMQRDGCAAARITLHVAAGVVEKWWQQP